ncbi:hypothetical protein FGV06_23340 [Salmonella enterica]|nr:hypothetical protein [Salmonella enterica]
MGSCAAPSAKGDDKFITTDYLQQCPRNHTITGGKVIANKNAKPLSLSSISALLFWFPDFVAVTFNLCFCRFGFARFCYRAQED